MRVPGPSAPDKPGREQALDHPLRLWLGACFAWLIDGTMSSHSPVPHLVTSHQEAESISPSPCLALANRVKKWLCASLEPGPQVALERPLVLEPCPA